MSKTISNPSLFISLLLGFTNLPSTYFEHSFNRRLFGSDIVIFLATLIFDTAKGYAVIFISSQYFPDYVYISGLICFLGHIFPVWLKFKGGKGIATYLGILLGISFYLALVFGISWLIIIYISKYSSISSIISSINVTSLVRFLWT